MLRAARTLVCLSLAWPAIGWAPIQPPRSRLVAVAATMSMDMARAGVLSSDFALPEGREGIILFDGVCNFCNRWVSFVLDNDPDGIFAFASLQSAAGRSLLEQCGRSPDDLSTFVVIDKGGFYTESSAALRVGAMLQIPALNSFSAALTRVPKPLRDGVYRTVADNRYSILGRDEDDATPSCKLRADAFTAAQRFLE
jgi:predicted DCC family thiol-disulfide oxidoreductase YuxK